MSRTNTQPRLRNLTDGKCYRIVDVRATGQIGKPGGLQFTLVPEMEKGTAANTVYTYPNQIDPRYWEVVSPDDLTGYNTYLEVSHDQAV